MNKLLWQSLKFQRKRSNVLWDLDYFIIYLFSLIQSRNVIKKNIFKWSEFDKRIGWELFLTIIFYFVSIVFTLNFFSCFLSHNRINEDVNIITTYQTKLQSILAVLLLLKWMVNKIVARVSRNIKIANILEVFLSRIRHKSIEQML